MGRESQAALEEVASPAVPSSDAEVPGQATPKLAQGSGWGLWKPSKDIVSFCLMVSHRIPPIMAPLFSNHPEFPSS